MAIDADSHAEERRQARHKVGSHGDEGRKEVKWCVVQLQTFPIFVEGQPRETNKRIVRQSASCGQ